MKWRNGVQAILVKPMPQTAAIEKEEHLMLKRIFFVIAASLLMLSIIGCACNGGTASPTPTASMAPVSTPDAALQTPGASADTSPDLNGSASPDAGANATIPNFQEGTEVKPEDVPEIKAAVEAKYSGATIKKIRHAMKDNQQAYEVELEQNGTTQKVYVLPNGTIMPESTTAQ